MSGGVRYVDPMRPRGRFYYALCRTSTTPLFLWLSPHVFWRLDPILLRFSRGRYCSTYPLMSGLLETTGAKSGAVRRASVLYFHDVDRVVIVASKRGDPKHPAWLHNLRASGSARFGGASYAASVVEDPAEYDRLWGLALRVFPPFAQYREWAGRSGRTIPIVVLTPQKPD